MKPFLPLICLASLTQASFATVNKSNDDYLQGRYFSALKAFVEQSKIDPVESYYLGRMNLYGYGQLKNNDKALRYFTQAGEGGFLPAQAIMARYMLLEKKDMSGAFYWFKKSADANDVNAQMFCAAAYLFGVGVNKNQDKARQYYIAAARQGNSVAQTTLSEYFLDSRHSGNKTLALIWLGKAVAQQDPKAQLLLGKLTAEGKIVPKNMEKALELINASVTQDYGPAMLQKGVMAFAEKDYTVAKSWYSRAIDAGYVPAQMAMADWYFDENNPLHDVHEGYLWTLKAAQNNLSAAQLALASMYTKGKGVEVNLELAKEWQHKAATSSSTDIEAQASRWLSNGKTLTFAASGFQLKGIFVDWNNQFAQRENSYNPSPQLIAVSKSSLYKPNFTLTSPSEIPISDYYDALVNVTDQKSKGALKLLAYPFDENITAIQKAASAKDETAVKAIVDKLNLQASLGVTEAQFDLGQLYQYGIGVKTDANQAMQWYESAAALDHLPSMYVLGLLNLEGKSGIKPNYNAGIAWLKDAAFKGNTYSQYALARIYEEGILDDANKVVIAPDPNQAESIYFLASADGNGQAQYRLAEILVRKPKESISVDAKQNRVALIKSLYQGAVEKNIGEAALPLAFFNAMDTDMAKQAEAFKVASEKAKTGDTSAALLLGLMLDRGIGTTASPKEAVQWVQKAGKNRVTDFILGTLYSTGSNGLAQDKAKGLAMLKQSASADFSYAHLNEAILEQEQQGSFILQLNKALAAGNSKAGLLLADYYLSRTSTEEEMKQAHEIYQWFADRGDKDAQLKLAYMYEKGIGGQADAQSAAKWYEMAASQGQPMAQYLLGRLYQVGQLDGKPDVALAKQWYSRAQSSYDPAAVALGFIYDTVEDNYQQAQTSYSIAAKHENPVGLYNEGLILEEGKGQEVNLQQAKALYQRAAEQGHAQSMVRLAGIYFNGGQGLEKDPQQALHWYQLAAEKGDRQALYQLGLLSETGVATSLDPAAALNYYQKAATLGDQQASLAVARMYQYGIGVAKDDQIAATYYRALAYLGNAFAQYQLAHFYDTHILTETRPGEGKKWLESARDNGSLQAQSLLLSVAAQRQTQLSYVAPVRFNHIPVTEMPVELMYMDALNQWNCGDALRAKMLFDRIRTQFPNYIPAKRTYEQMKLG